MVTCKEGEQGRSFVREQNRNEMVAAGGKRASGEKGSRKNGDDDEGQREREGTTKDFVGRLSCHVLSSPAWDVGGHITTTREETLLWPAQGFPNSVSC